MAKTQIPTDQIRDLAVTAAKLADLAVATAKLANLAVTNGKIANLTITNAKVNAAAAIAESKLNLTRNTNSLIQGNVNLLTLVTGSCTILAGTTSIAVTFPGAFTFSNLSFRASVTRTSVIAADLYVYDASNIWVDTKVAGGFTLHINASESANINYDYICIGL